VYLPRMAGDGFDEAAGVSGFFIEGSFGWSGEPGADDADGLFVFIMNYDEEAIGGGQAGEDEAFVARCGLGDVGLRGAKGVEETGSGFFEGGHRACES